MCGAALWVAALLHDSSAPKRDTSSRVVAGSSASSASSASPSLKTTPSAFLSVDEFDAKASAKEKEQAALPDVTREERSPTATREIVSHTTALTCGTRTAFVVASPLVASVMCCACYVEYARVSEGAVGGEDPPAFKAAELKRKKIAREIFPRTTFPRASRGPPSTREWRRRPPRRGRRRAKKKLL